MTRIPRPIPTFGLALLAAIWIAATVLTALGVR